MEIKKGIRLCRVTNTANGWLVVLRIYVASTVFQPYRDLEAGNNQSLKSHIATWKQEITNLWKGYFLLPSRDMAEIPLKLRKSSIQPTNQPFWRCLSHDKVWYLSSSSFLSRHSSCWSVWRKRGLYWKRDVVKIYYWLDYLRLRMSSFRSINTFFCINVIWFFRAFEIVEINAHSQRK